MLETISYSRSIAPSIPAETASFSVTIVAKISTDDERDQIMDFAKAVYECAAMPIARSMRLDPSVPQPAPRIVIDEPDEELSDGIWIEKIVLSFGQTWVVGKPYPTTIAPSCSTEIESLDGSIEPILIVLAWQSLIGTVLRAAEESLFAAGRWYTRLDDWQHAVK